MILAARPRQRREHREEKERRRIEVPLRHHAIHRMGQQEPAEQDHRQPRVRPPSSLGRDVDEPLPDLSIFPPAIMEFESPPGTYVDAFPLLLMTTSALRSLSAALPDSAVDVRRFRPNVVIDTPGLDGHPEFGWVGRRLGIGTVVLEIVEACPRCVMVTRAVDEVIDDDRRVLRHIVRDLDQNVGVYATVVVPGEISVGDDVAVLES